MPAVGKGWQMVKAGVSADWALLLSGEEERGSSRAPLFAVTAAVVNRQCVLLLFSPISNTPSPRDLPLLYLDFSSLYTISSREPPYSNALQ